MSQQVPRAWQALGHSMTFAPSPKGSALGGSVDPGEHTGHGVMGSHLNLSSWICICVTLNKLFNLC